MNLPSIHTLGGLALVALLSGCVAQETKQTSLPENLSDAHRVEDLALVDCLLPGQIRQLGTRMTYLSPRRYIKTTQSDCGMRGGEFIRFDRADYKTALQVLLPKARSGDVIAQTYVGEIYEKGLGLPAPDYAAAAHWYAQAAAQGYAPAQTNLGLLYERGLGVPKDAVRTVEKEMKKASGAKKSAQMGKLELSLRQQSDALADNRRRLAMMLK